MSETATFPLGKAIPEAELAERFIRLEDEPYGNPDLAYSLVAPNDYLQLGLEADDGVLHADRLKLLSHLLSPLDRDANAVLQVWCQGLIKEITAADWLKWYLTQTGREVESLQAVSPYFADAVATWEIDAGPIDGVAAGSVTHRMRVAARVAGNRLFLVQCSAPDDLYPDYAEVFGLAISSFKVTKELENPHVEVWTAHTLDEQITFHAPFSWPAQEPAAPEGVAAVDLANLNAEAAAIAVIKAITVRKSLTEGKSGVDLPALLVGEFTKIGVEVIGVASDEPLATGELFTDGRFKILTARLPKGDDRLRNLLIAEFNSETHHVLIGLLTCAPNASYYEYAVNRRAFDIVLETIDAK